MKAPLAAAQDEWALVPKVERIEGIVHRLPGPVGVRARRLLFRLAGIRSWPLPHAEEARAAILAEDFAAAEPAEASGNTIAVVGMPLARGR